ncbi:MAG: ribonuclease [Oxalobacter sp.]|nr:MAG: ribonuclease [Oxalobacter sp.]
MTRRLLKKWQFLALGLLFAAGVHAKGLVGDVAVFRLPPEARQTLVLIKQGGPFPYEKDGKTFGNYEGSLPKQKRGYYREYTVKTPGVRNRGARRIVAGGKSPAAQYYYTADHYATFRRIRE